MQYPPGISRHCHYQMPPPLLIKMIFPISFKQFVSRNSQKNESEIIWIYLIFLRIVKCRVLVFSFFIMMMSSFTIDQGNDKRYHPSPALLTPTTATEYPYKVTVIQSPVPSVYKWPVMQTVRSCDDVLMEGCLGRLRKSLKFPNTGQRHLLFHCDIMLVIFKGFGQPTKY